MEQSKSPDTNPREQVDKISNEMKEPVTKKQKEQADILKEVGEILQQFGGREANVPLTSLYWDLLNRYRSLNY